MQVIGITGMNAGILGDVHDDTTDEDLAEQGLARWNPDAIPAPTPVAADGDPATEEHSPPVAKTPAKAPRKTTARKK